MEFPIGKKISLGFGLALLVLSIISVFSYLSITEFIKTNDMQQNIDDVSKNLERVFSQLKDVESSQRGYVISGQESYMEPYKVAIVSIDQGIKNLRELTANPNQRRRLNTLESMISEKLDFA